MNLTDPFSSPVAPRPAATVVVLRPGRASGLEVLLMRRSDTVAFMGGAYVFPGGRVDDADRNVPLDPGMSGRRRFTDLALEEESAYRAAAVRELKEEAGLDVQPADLDPLAHWVTPEAERRRYDTRFFAAVLPPGQEVRHDGVETTAFDWMTPADALARCRAGSIQLPPPTWTELRRLEADGAVDSALARLARTPIARVMPQMLRSPESTMLVLPGDALYSGVDQAGPFAETRFVLIEGRGWQPTRS